VSARAARRWTNLTTALGCSTVGALSNEGWPVRTRTPGGRAQTRQLTTTIIKRR
jgi:hypothetical protein